MLKDVSGKAALLLTKICLKLVGFLSVTMKRFEETKTLRPYLNISAVYHILRQMEWRPSRPKHLGHADMQKMKMNIIHEPMADNLKPLDRCGTGGFQVHVDVI